MSEDSNDRTPSCPRLQHALCDQLETQKQDTQANKRTPLLREEVPYQITLITLRQWQGSLDRRRREKVIRKMFTEDDCYPFTDLEGES